MSSRWADEEADKALRQKEKEEKARKKLLKQQKLEQQAALAAKKAAAAEEQQLASQRSRNDEDERPAKRQRTEEAAQDEPTISTSRYRPVQPTWRPCRHVSDYETLNAIEEGSYGWVSRARHVESGSIVALKHLKLDPSTTSQEGFPITALREIQALKSSRSHDNIVTLHDVITGSTPSTNDVYLVMEFVEHDLKTLQESMETPFAISEVKTLMLQITSAVDYLHTHWILHRDLKTSNILLSNRGVVKLADFGMARTFGDPMPPALTQLVVTLWYRAPELLLGADKYDTAIDVWSLGCVMGELLRNEPLLPGKNEVDQLSRIFATCGIPSSKTWPRFRSLPNARHLNLPSPPQTKEPTLRSLVADPTNLSTAGVRLLESLLSLNPNRRPDAGEVLEHPWFTEDPRPKSTAMFPTFPSKAGQERRRRRPTPQAPRGGEAPKLDAADFSAVFG